MPSERQLQILALVELSLKVISLLGDIKDASSDRAKILAELNGGCRILRSLAEHAEKIGASLPNTAGLVVAKGPLVEYKVILEKLVPKLTAAKGVKDVGRKNHVRCKE